MRKLNFGDTFKIAALAKNIGIDKLAEIYQKAIDASKGKTEDEQKDILNDYGVELIAVFFNGYENSEKELVDLMASLSGMTTEEIKGMDLEEVYTWVESFLSVNEPKKVISFFTKAFSSLK
jgi:hypothetical protein